MNDKLITKIATYGFVGLVVAPAAIGLGARLIGTAANGVIALDKRTLEEKWNFKTNPALIYTSPYSKPSSSTVETSPVLVGDTVFFGASDGILYALNRISGKLLWKYQIGVPIFSTVSVAENVLYVTDFAGNVYGFIMDN